MVTIERKTNWYVVRTQSQREKSVAEKIEKQSETGDLMGKVSRVIVPSEAYYVIKNGKKVKKERIKFPGYIFIQTNAIGELKYFLKGTNGATGFLTDRGGNVVPLSNSEVSRMIGEWEESKRVDLTEELNHYVPGEEVVILEGPFSTFTGKVESVKGNKVKVEVVIFGRTNVIELSNLQIDRKKD